MLARVAMLLRLGYNIYDYDHVIKMKSIEFIFALVLLSILSESSSSPSIFSVLYVPRESELAQLGLGEMMWGDNTVDWERLHTTVSMQTQDGRKAGCRYRVSVVPVDGDGLPIAVIRGQARELGCEVELCGLNDGDEVCAMSNSNYSDVMGKCHLSIPTSLAEAGNGYRWVGLESTAISVEAGCQLSSESLPGLTALLEPYTAVYECASDEFWSQDVQECLPCETDDTTYLCSPGFYVKGCDSLAHVLDESTICSPCPNTPADFASGHYRWKEGEECVLECDPGLFYMNGTVCEPCTELLRACADEESNHCCAKQAGQMWRACTATENEACVDCPVISKSIYSENEEFIPWSHECEHYLQEDGDLSALCECHTTCKDGFYRSLEPDLLDSLPCVPCSGMVDLAVQARLTRTSNEFFRYQQCTKASNTQLVQCVGKPIGCDGVPYSTVVVDICGICGGSNDTCTGCDGVIASGKIEDACGLCDGDNTTCAGCDGVPNSGLVVDVCNQCGGDNTSCWGCDNVSNSGLVFDACGECGGDGSSCWGCDNVSNSGLVFDACDVCGGDNATCTGCDGVLFSGKVFDSCGVCDGGDQALDGCGVCYGDNTSCVGCDGIFKSGIFNDSCGICGGDNSTCAGCDGIPYSGKVVDVCGVCGGDNTTCIGCDGVLNSGKKIDECNVCGGDNTTCECDVGYTGPQYGNRSDSCVHCGPGTYKDVIGSAACTECGFNTYNPQHGSTSSDACLPCMEHSETEEIYGHESIHACMCISGYYHDTPTSCTACTPGTFNAEKNQTQCSTCDAGSYSGSPASVTCQQCSSNTYSHEGSALCTNCPSNTESAAVSTVVADCICKKGYTGPDGGHCQACLAGTYKSVTGSGACIPCGSGTYSTSSAATTCSTCQTCASGQYLSSCGSASAGTCVNCLAESAKCTANTYLFNCGGSYGGACTPCPSCPAGEQRNGCTGVSAGSCGACPSGTFKPSAGTEPCQTCPTCSAGKYNMGTCDGINSNTCVDCVAGKYSNVAGLSACLDCQAGKISGSAAATICTTCTEGSTPSADNTTCKGCDNVADSGLVFDFCLECGGDNSTCIGCDGVMWDPLGCKTGKIAVNVARYCGSANDQACAVSASSTRRKDYSYNDVGDRYIPEKAVDGVKRGEPTYVHVQDEETAQLYGVDVWPDYIYVHGTYWWSSDVCDYNNGGTFSSCVASPPTNCEDTYFKLDLGQQYNITRVELFNGDIPDEMHNLDVRVGDNGDDHTANSICAVVGYCGGSIVCKDHLVLDCNAFGQYVYLTTQSGCMKHQNMGIVELEVYGLVPYDCAAKQLDACGICDGDGSSCSV